MVWPKPPEPAAARLLAILPDPQAERNATPWWRRALGWITGADASTEEGSTLVRPFAVALGSRGQLFVADPDAARVLRFDQNGRREEIACKRHPWGAPMALGLATDGSLYVADSGEGVVVRWTPDRCEVLGAGLLERPTGIALAPDRIWIADPPRHQLVALSYAGALLARIGGQGEGDDRFHFPVAVTLAPDGSLLVVDSLNFRIVRLGGDGRWIGAFGTPGDEGGNLARPKGITTAGDGTILVSDAQRDAVLAFSPAGAFLFALGATGGDPGRFTHPAGLDRRGDRLAVADSQNRRIQVFELLKEHR